MDEKTIERSLRQGRPSEPGYRPRLDAVAVGRVFAQEDGPSVHQQMTPQLARFLTMNSMLKVVGVAVLALAVGVTILPRGPDIGAAPAPSASPSPSPSAVPFPGPSTLAPGTYTGPLGEGRWTVTVPEGWEWFYDILWKDLDGVSDETRLGGPGEVAFIWWDVANVFADPCHWKDSLADPPVGPTVDDLATAFVEQVGRDGSGPTDVIFGGYPAKRVELSVPADLDVASCDEGVYREFLDVGESLTLPADHEPTPDIRGEVSVLYILDVDGTRQMMRTWHRPDASEQDLAELEAMLASIVIEPPAPSPTASTSPGALAWRPASLEQDWPAPVREEPAGEAVVVPFSPAGSYVDPADVTGSDASPWIDIVGLSSVSSDHMYVELAEPIPTPRTDPAERWIAYGLVLDSDDDGVPDVRLGIDNTPVAEGGHRAWRTDLHTGKTESATGSPYGAVGDSYFDTFYPGEDLPYGPVGSARFGLDEGTFRFYAWASVIEDGRVVATDYAPDAGWLEADPGAARNDYLIGVSTLSGSGWSEALLCSIKAQALASGRVAGLEIEDRATDATGQLEDVRDLLYAGVDAIIIDPTGPGAMESITEATDAGIPVVSIGSGVTAPAMSLISNDEEESAYLSARWLFEQIGGVGAVVAVDGSRSTGAEIDGKAGFERARQEFPGITVATDIRTNGDAQAGKLQMLDILASGLPFDGVWTSGTASTLVEAFQESGQPFKPIVAADSRGFVQQLVDVEGLSGAIVTDPAAVGGAGVTLALRILDGQPVEPVTRFTPMIMQNTTEEGRANLATVADAAVPSEWPTGITLADWTTYRREQVLPSTGCQGPGE